MPTEGDSCTGNSRVSLGLSYDHAPVPAGVTAVLGAPTGVMRVVPGARLLCGKDEVLGHT